MSLSVKNSKAPVVGKRAIGKVRYGWRLCPWSTADSTDRVPLAEKAEHFVTSGYMALQVRDGHGKVGFVCEDPNCPYLLGNAVTQLYTVVQIPIVDRVSGEYTVSGYSYPIPLCSGINFFEY